MSATQRLDGSGGVDLNIPIRAINRTDEPITWIYDRQRYTLLPGLPSFVPYMAMVFYRGDPRAINLPGGSPHTQYRSNELHRIQFVNGIHYGANEGNLDVIPLIDCYPLDSDVPFATVIADPTGESLSGESATNSELDFMRRSQEEMAGQLRALQAQVRMREQEEGALDAAGIAPEDLDYQATTSRVATPEEATGQSMVGPSPARRSPVPTAKRRPEAGEGPQVTRDGE